MKSFVLSLTVVATASALHTRSVEALALPAVSPAQHQASLRVRSDQGVSGAGLTVVSSWRSLTPAQNPIVGVYAPTFVSAPPANQNTAIGQFKDGSFAGGRVDAYWGYVQVRAVIKSGKLVSVDILTYPADRSRSRQISDYALPILQREVVQAQSAKVNIVSGATLTSQAYIASLRGALVQAQ
jgi:uncharacterized protein with FMN-binding domain